jgi:hypothetical protein
VDPIPGGPGKWGPWGRGGGEGAHRHCGWEVAGLVFRAVVRGVLLPSQNVDLV